MLKLVHARGGVNSSGKRYINFYAVNDDLSIKIPVKQAIDKSSEHFFMLKALSEYCPAFDKILDVEVKDESVNLDTPNEKKGK